MTWAGSFNVGIDRMRRLALLVEHGQMQEQMGSLLGEDIGRIVKRTQAGRDKDYHEFEGYTKAYRLKKLRAKRSTTNVDLTWRGANGGMLGSLHWKVEAFKGYILGKIFVGNWKEALGHITGQNPHWEKNHKRNFLGFSDQFMAKCKKLIQGAIKDAGK